jgi:hypothetical protein
MRSTLWTKRQRTVEIDLEARRPSGRTSLSLHVARIWKPVTTTITGV